MIILDRGIVINESEIEFTAVRSQGAGGQNVNKVASAIHLRFNIAESTLPLYVKDRLLGLNDTRISGDGIIVIKAQSSRDQPRNKEQAVDRLITLINSVLAVQKRRRPTKPGRGAMLRRLESRKIRKRVKEYRKKVESD